jgi:propanol-preferring alcohol dehydrogenase
MAVTAYDRPLVELDLPEPALRPGHALLEVLTCGVCFSDVKTSRGQMPFSASLALPHVPGHEVCARVLATDPPGAFAEGDVVVAHHYWPCGRCRRCMAGDECLCTDRRGWFGFTHPGAFQQRVVIPVGRLLRVPAEIDPIAAAPMTCALGTGYHAVVTRGGARPGTTVAVIGLGGVGIHALQVAAASGARAVGLDIAPRAIAKARELGLDARDAAAFDRESSGLPQVEEEGFDVVVVTAGSAGAYRSAADLIRRGGRVVAVGYAMDSAVALETSRLVLNEVELRGSLYVTRDELARAIELVRAGRVLPVVDNSRPLDEINAAFDDLLAGEVVGRTVLRVAA